ncbi:MAG: hypothetical protein AAFY42_12835, partial [Pseudomonadota bacterium]
MTELDPATEAELERLTATETSEDELYALLAQSAGLGADEIDPVGEGKLQFSRIWQRVGNKICKNKVVQAYVGNPTASDATMVSAQIINLLSEIEGINVVVVTALILRIGLRSLCST